MKPVSVIFTNGRGYGKYIRVMCHGAWYCAYGGKLRWMKEKHEDIQRNKIVKNVQDFGGLWINEEEICRAWHVMKISEVNRFEYLASIRQWIKMKKITKEDKV